MMLKNNIKEWWKDVKKTILRNNEKMFKKTMLRNNERFKKIKKKTILRNKK